MARKRDAINVLLVSTAGTGYAYTKKRNFKKNPKKLELKKYDPRAKKHVVFKEEKLTYH